MRLLLLIFVAVSLHAQTGENVLVVVNRADPDSVRIGQHYQQRRSIPAQNICPVEVVQDDEITWQTYQEAIEQPVTKCLIAGALLEKVLYIVTIRGVPIRVAGSGDGNETEVASVDSELALLYGKLKGNTYPRAGRVPNPFFGKMDAPFRHPTFPIYLVTRLAAWDPADVIVMINHALDAKNRGKFVIDLRVTTEDGDTWLRSAARQLPPARVILDSTPEVLYQQKDVIGYASWGSNDPNRKQRWMAFGWLPGAIVTDFVSTNGRTMRRPPDNWIFPLTFAGSQQSLSTDYIHEGATGASANVYEPYLNSTVRPDYLLPAYYRGRTLAEAYYLAMPFLSWQGMILGDPLCSLGKP